MKKFLLLVVILSAIPSVTFASWWNPFSWNIFSSSITSTTTLSKVTPVSKIFYIQTDGTKVHDCASLTCKVVGYYPINTGMTLPYASTADLPEWMQFVWQENKGNINGYVKSTTLGENLVSTTTLTSTPTTTAVITPTTTPTQTNIIKSPIPKRSIRQAEQWQDD